MRRLSQIKPLPGRICRCLACDEEFIDDLDHLTTVNKTCPNGCGWVLEWLYDVEKKEMLSNAKG